MKNGRPQDTKHEFRVKNLCFYKVFEDLGENILRK